VEAAELHDMADTLFH